MTFGMISEKIADETGTDMETAEVMARQLQKIHPDLKGVVEAWYQGKEIGFTLDGITMDIIREKEGGAYVNAIFSMSVLLKNPDMAKGYLSWQPRRRERRDQHGS